MKPAVKPNQCHRGGTIRQFNQSHYIIGINKLGTLLSSQTTDTPGTTQTNVQDRSGATFQTYPTRRSLANQRFRDSRLQGRSPARVRHTAKCTVFQAVRKGVGRYLSASAAATRMTLHGTAGACKSSRDRRTSPAHKHRTATALPPERAVTYNVEAPFVLISSTNPGY